MEQVLLFQLAPAGWPSGDDKLSKVKTKIKTIRISPQLQQPILAIGFAVRQQVGNLPPIVDRPVRVVDGSGANRLNG